MGVWDFLTIIRGCEPVWIKLGESPLSCHVDHILVHSRATVMAPAAEKSVNDVFAVWHTYCKEMDMNPLRM